MSLRDRTLLLAVSGSRAHGTSRPESDVDVSGVAVPTQRQALGLFEVFEQTNAPADLRPFERDLTAEEREVAGRSKLEGTVFSVGKVLRLAETANPNILELLFTRSSEIRRLHPLGERLLAARDLFLTARCKGTFGGYAASQLGRIQLHYRWHTAGEIEPPLRADFGLPEQTLIPREQLLAAESAIQRQMDAWELDLSELEPSLRDEVEARVARTLSELQLATDDARWGAAARWIGLDDNLVEVMVQERAWRSARNEYKRYREWRENRNPARAQLEAAHGYDTKHGAHLVRLLRMGQEIAETGQVHVWRGDRDADELAFIRAGGWSYERLCEWTEAATERLRTTRSTLPPRADRDAIDALCIELVTAGFRLAG